MRGRERGPWPGRKKRKRKRRTQARRRLEWVRERKQISRRTGGGRRPYILKPRGIGCARDRVSRAGRFGRYSTGGLCLAGLGFCPAPCCCRFFFLLLSPGFISLASPRAAVVGRRPGGRCGERRRRVLDQLPERRTGPASGGLSTTWPRLHALHLGLERRKRG